MDSSVDCDAIRERLPWLLNGSLEAEEAGGLEAHLEGCAACREERDRARLAARLFATHPTAGDLVAHAFGDLDDAARAALGAHLAACEGCRQELDLVTASRDVMDGGAGATVGVRPLPASRARALATAAAVAALIAAGGWWVTWQRLRSADAVAEGRQAALQRRLEDLEAAAARPGAPPPLATPAATPAAGERIAALERELAGLRQPSAGLAVLELVPEEMVVRGAPAATPALAGGEPAMLLLVAEGIADGGRYRVRVERAGVPWEGAARAARAGELALYLPARSLPPGRHRLQVLTPAGETVASYRIVVR